MLLAIRDYIHQEKMVSTQQLTRVFQIEFAALKPMLTLLENKGVIDASNARKACQSLCTRCVEGLEYYSWRAA
jgi:hypothetical protein